MHLSFPEFHHSAAVLHYDIVALFVELDSSVQIFFVKIPISSIKFIFAHASRHSQSDCFTYPQCVHHYTLFTIAVLKFHSLIESDTIVIK